MSDKSNSSLTRPSRELEKSALDRLLALSHTDFSTQPTNLTQDTRIAEDSNESSLRGESQDLSPFCHTERVARSIQIKRI